MLWTQKLRLVKHGLDSFTTEDIDYKLIAYCRKLAMHFINADFKNYVIANHF